MVICHAPKMDTVIEAVGLLGATGILFAYYKVSHGSWSPRSRAYQLCNIIAASLLIGYGVHKAAYANILINLVWVVIGVVALVGILRPARKKRPRTKR